MGDYRKVAVWARAHRLTLDVYRITREFPQDERSELRSQLRRAASSVPANIAEGCGRNSDAELARFLVIALGSLTELDYHLLLAHDLGYLPTPDYEPLRAEIMEVSNMRSAFRDTVRRSKG